MTSALEPIPAADVHNSPQPEPENLAVKRCCQAWTLAFRAALKAGKSDYGAEEDAHRAYRISMPPLSGAENIRHFIACVAHGMLIEAIDGPDAARLLYAAQVAHTALNGPPSKKKQEAK